MLFGVLDLEVLSPCEVARQEVAAAMGSLAMRVDDAEFGTVTFPYCSAFLVSPRHVLTAAHCAGQELVFDPGRVAAREDVRAFRVVEVGSTVRLRFEGQTIAPHAGTSPVEKLGAPLHVDAFADFAVFALSQPRPSAFVDLRDVTPPAGEALFLYGYPNGLPLARSFHCRVMTAPSLGVLFHDCDSMKGSSGGLLVSASGAPVAMHLRASGQNDAAHFRRTGHFESPGSSGGDAGIVPPYNEAVELAFVARRLEEQAPWLWKEIRAASSDGSGERGPRGTTTR